MTSPAEQKAREIAEDLCDGLEDRGWLAPKIAQALTEFARDEIAKLFEGEDSKVARLEQEALAQGYKEGYQQAKRELNEKD
jgi:flagellar biosynthesis/type III secretory pathway protein FliH